jgi:hypothetical protein
MGIALSTIPIGFKKLRRVVTATPDSIRDLTPLDKKVRYGSKDNTNTEYVFRISSPFEGPQVLTSLRHCRRLCHFFIKGVLGYGIN